MSRCRGGAALAGRLVVGVLLAGLLLAGPSSLGAQETGAIGVTASPRLTGTFAGRVTDAAGGRSLVADILVDDGAGGRARTAADGRWRIDSIVAGRHRLRIRAPGFRVDDAEVVARASEVTTRDVRLQPAMVPLEAMVVTAARREQRLADAVVETALISRAEVQRSGASELATILTERSGLSLDGGVPAGAGVQMRGFDSRRVLVLVDGAPLAGRINGNLDLSRFPASVVERIEIVKGPQSTLYGSDAMGGVINIVTRRPPDGDRWSGALSSTMGTVGRRELAGEAGWKSGAWSAIGSGGHRSINLAPGVPGDAGTFARRYDGGGTARWTRDAAHQVDAGVLAIGERQRYRTGQLFHFADNTQLGGRLTSRSPLGAGQLTGAISASTFSHLSRASTGDQPASDSGAQDRQRLLQGTLLFNGHAGPGLVDAGLELRSESIDADRLAATAARELHQAEPFAQLTLPAGPASVTPGVRVTASSRWGTFVAPRLAALWRPQPALAVRAALGRGFRSPDFKELYLDFVNEAAGYAVKGNPDLRPESSTSASVGAEWDGERLYLRSSLFHNAYRDFIDTRSPDATGTYTYDNVGHGTTSGVELEGGLFVSRWRLDGSYDLLHTHDDDVGGPLLGRPPRTARASARGPVALGVRGTLSFSHVARTPVSRTSDGAIAERSSYTRIDARASRGLRRGLDVSAGVTNLFDQRPGDAWPGFTGRQVSLSLAWRSGGSP